MRLYRVISAIISQQMIKKIHKKKVTQTSSFLSFKKTQSHFRSCLQYSQLLGFYFCSIPEESVKTNRKCVKVHLNPFLTLSFPQTQALYSVAMAACFFFFPDLHLSSRYKTPSIQEKLRIKKAITKTGVLYGATTVHAHTHEHGGQRNV